tara:strand:- start:731 stop:1204 length:474 start_codon:yes stop_codon:yes gene_type:complete
MIKDKWVIFDLDGTLANIETRRKMAIKSNGKMDWDIFFADRLVELDDPNQPVIDTCKALSEKYNIAIFSGRSKSTKPTTVKWLEKHGVPFNVLKMRPTSHPWKFMPDDKLKQQWLDDLFPRDSKRLDIVCVFDDRDKVVNMWRDNGLTCMQVAPGNF